MTHPTRESQRRPLKPSSFERTMSAGELAELDAVLGAAMDLVRPGASVPIDEVTDFASASQALSDAWATVRQALEGGPRPDEGGGRVDPLVLIDRLRRLELGIRDGEARRRREILQAVGPALGRLQSVDSLPRLVALVPEVICGLGFDRAIVSSVVDAHWVTQAAYVVGDEEWATVITRTGQEAPAPLRGTRLPESEVVRRRVPVVVHDVQGAALVYRPMATATLSRSYVAAPIVLDSQVVGLVHGDRVFHRGETDSFDQDMLAMFAHGLSLAFERASMRARLASIRSSLRQLAGDAEIPDGPPPGFGDPAAALRAQVRPIPTHPSPSVDMLIEQLTRRELQIVRHLVPVKKLWGALRGGGRPVNRARQ